MLGDERHAAEGDPGELAEGLFAHYSAGEIDVSVMCDLEAETLGDRPRTEFAALLREVAAESAPAVRTEIRALLREAKARGLHADLSDGLTLVSREVTEWREVDS